jgi:hypothetical protein
MHDVLPKENVVRSFIMYSLNSCILFILYYAFILGEQSQEKAYMPLGGLNQCMYVCMKCPKHFLRLLLAKKHHSLVAGTPSAL